MTQRIINDTKTEMVKRTRGRPSKITQPIEQKEPMERDTTKIYAEPGTEAKVKAKKQKPYPVIPPKLKKQTEMNVEQYKKI